MRDEEAVGRPFLKWAGGKSQLLDAFVHCYPEELWSGGIVRYVEPFVGSGAVMFDIVQRFAPEQVVINDQNPRLMQVYRVIQTAVEDLIAELSIFQERYWAAAHEARATMYYAVRDAFNQHDGTDIHHAAQFIFLNRTCFNGLYRVNSRSAFNVPMGRYRKPMICDATNLRRAHTILEGVTILTGDYHQVADYAGPKTFVYIDPPYRPLSATASFTAYSGSFNDDDQRRLASFARKLGEKGARVMLSNSDSRHRNPEDDFFDALYHDFVLTRVPARRSINSRSDRRGPVDELVITSYSLAPIKLRT